MEEPESLQSEDSSSVRTSDDEFEVDTEGVFDLVRSKLNQKKAEHDGELRRSQVQSSLAKNVPHPRNPFGRKHVYMCASFNDWIPSEMKSMHEIRLEKAKGDKLEEYIKECEEEGNFKALRHPKPTFNVI